MGTFEIKEYTNIGRISSSWYTDHAYFVYSISPWFVRGGDYTHGLHSGSFAIGGCEGSSTSPYSSSNASTFRLILTPTGGTL